MEENTEAMTIIKERIDRLMEELELTEQKITFLEQSLEKQRELTNELKVLQNTIEMDGADLKKQIEAMK